LKSRRLHAPGPPGSPQELQGAVLGALVPPLLLETAKVESWGASFLLWHFGHCAFRSPYTSASKACSQSWQTYSKIGIKPLSLFVPQNTLNII
jgi:hypothetical protein